MYIYIYIYYIPAYKHDFGCSIRSIQYKCITVALMAITSWLSIAGPVAGPVHTSMASVMYPPPHC